MKRSLILAALGTLFTLSVLTIACSRTASQQAQQRYHCPMHPTVVSDRAGECPICHMDLVPIDEARTGSDRADTAPQQPAPLFYRNPMNPAVTSPTPMKDEMGMDYVPVYPEELAGAGPTIEGRTAVRLDASGITRAGIRTEAVKRETVAHNVRTVGVVVADETRVHHLHLKVSGFVEHLYVAFEGDVVRAGEPVLSVYSPELVAAQEEFVRALAADKTFATSRLPEIRSGGADLVSAARRRLERLDVPDSLITHLEQAGDAQREVTIYSPHSGFVTAKDVYEGMQVEPGLELFTITDLSHVWIEADVFEAEAQLVVPGLPATLTLAYDPSLKLAGRVAYIFPTFRSETRTLRVRFDFPNPALRLKPGMFSDVQLQLEPRDALIVSDSAVIDTGTRQLVFVQSASGEFEPRTVTIGLRGDRRAEVLSGVNEGEHVVVEGNFLLDSESRLRAAIAGATTAERAP